MLHQFLSAKESAYHVVPLGEPQYTLEVVPALNPHGEGSFFSAPDVGGTPNLSISEVFNEEEVRFLRMQLDVPDCPCRELVMLCYGARLSAKTPEECANLFQCLCTPEEHHIWINKLLRPESLLSEVTKRIEGDISELDIFANCLGVYGNDPTDIRRHLREKYQKLSKDAAKARIFYQLSKLVPLVRPLDPTAMKSVFDSIDALKGLVSDQKEIDAVYEVFQCFYALRWLLSPDGNQKVFMIIGSMVLGDGIFHQRGGHMSKKAQCLEALIKALIAAFPVSDTIPA